MPLPGHHREGREIALQNIPLNSTRKDQGSHTPKTRDSWIGLSRLSVIYSSIIRALARSSGMSPSLSPKLESIFVTWLLTVSSVIASWSAITLFALPVADNPQP